MSRWWPNGCVPTLGRGGRARLVGMVVLGTVASIGSPHLEAQSLARTSVDTTLVTVGDRITLTVSIEHPADAAVLWPDSLSLEPFEILGAQVEPTVPIGDRATSTARFSLAAFELGDIEIPTFEVTVLRADGSTEVVETDRFGVEVVTVGADETGDIRDIRGPLAIPISAVRITLGGLLLLLVGAASYAAFLRLRTSATPSNAHAPGPPPRPAHEVTLEALDRLEASPLLARGQVKEYHIEVSDILRRYVEARYGVAALEMTTWEVLAGLERAGVDRGLREGLRSFLEPCDMVKFAKVRPSASDSVALLSLGRELVMQAVKSLAGYEGPGQREEREEDSMNGATAAAQATNEGVGV